MKLSRKNWNNYVTRLSAINKTAGRKMQAWIDKHGTDDVDALVQVAYALTTKYGEAASAVSCQMYDEIAEIQKANVPPAEPKPTQHINYVDRAVRDTLARAPGTVPGTVSEMVKRTGAETTLKNAIRDGAYFAWVPHGDTCAFCITLASNGWRRASKKTLNGDHAEHIHQNCDCEFAISFNGPGNIEGYDPDKYREIYDNAEGGNWKDKMNSLRRAHYAANKDMINAQKRAAYARRVEIKNSAAAGTLPEKMKKYIPSADERERIIQEGIAAERPIFVDKDDDLYKLAINLPEEEGCYTVVLHGTPYSLIYHGKEIDADTLCAIIAQRPDYKKGTDIRLISCYTGQVDDGVARYISDKLKVRVVAPDKLGIINKNIYGKYQVYSGSEIGKHDGTMVPFEYKKSGDRK